MQGNIFKRKFRANRLLLRTRNTRNTRDAAENQLTFVTTKTMIETFIENDKMGKKVGGLEFPIGITNVWSGGKGVVDNNINNQLREIGTSWIDPQTNTLARKSTSNYEKVRRNFNQLPQNNQNRLDAMIGLAESSKRMYYDIDVSFNRYLALKSEIEREYNNTIKMLLVNIRNTNYEGGWTEVKRLAKVKEREELEKLWDRATGVNSILQIWKTTMEDVDPENTNGLIGQMYKWINIIEINIINSLRQDGVAIITGGGGKYSASWLTNDDAGGKNPKFVKPWDKQNHIVSDKLFNFVNKNTTQSSSDRIDKLKKISQIKTFNMESKEKNKKNPNYYFKTNKDTEITKYKNHSTRLALKKGFNIMNRGCRLTTKLAQNLKDSVVTEVDIGTNYLMDGGNGDQTGFEINGKRTAMGLLAKPAEMDKVFNAPLFEKISKNKVKKNNDKCSLVKNENNVSVPLPHKIHPQEKHYHYFPISGKKYGLYIHSHKDIDHRNTKIPNVNFQFFTQRFSKNPKVDF